MTPTDLKEARRKLGLSQSALAKALRVTSRSVQKWEGGETKEVPGPVAVAIEFMLAAVKA